MRKISENLNLYERIAQIELRDKVDAVFVKLYALKYLKMSVLTICICISHFSI